ncbi:MAG TPA: hypothetical protein VJ553_04615, partial [Candidatus Paceibacterota bacterium]|nr:hypothetical protein [Candidatus Paceibacterota bacterium]
MRTVPASRGGNPAMIDEPQPISKEPVVGDLVKTTPYSEVTATLEVLDRWGVERKHLAKLRRASSYVQSMVAKAIIQSDEKFFMGEAPAHPRVPLRFLDRTVSVTMDLAKTAAQLIADGTYDWVNSDIATRFSIQPEEGIRTAEVHLLHYNKRMTSDQVIADMDRQGLRPAT